ncbi:hypothetical protein DXG03_004727 [Asterophora parasitica]|uniref:Probable RNA-binding protein 18 n=1 Tax=Asterophora parasitica TaxID=117018 RepID=A0A9P7GEY5_9AGAR|nr:hypothetical protein DXG03_004727 [Asterophora parasitica]
MDTSLDSLETHSESPTPGANEHLSFPVTFPDESPAESSASASTPTPRALLKDRLYIGNLHPSVDEYSLLQLFSKFGKVTKLDFLFHKAGALKGKPRGYAFVEYDSPDEARKALSTAHDKLIRGRKLVVTFAHQAPIEQSGAGTGMYSAKRRNMMETGRPTTLSLLKSGTSGKHDGTKDKIAMMEAKLRQMESTNPKPAPVPGSSAGDSPSASSARPTTTPLYHASLPPKPPPAIPEKAAQMQARPAKPKTPLPQLPLSRASHAQGATGSYLTKTSTAASTTTLARIAESATTAAATSATTTKPVKTKLIGVKLGVKKKANVSTSDGKG